MRTPVPPGLFRLARGTTRISPRMLYTSRRALLTMSTMRCCCSSVAVYADCATAPTSWVSAVCRLTCAGIDALGDLLPRRSLNLLGRGAAFVGELEKPLAAFAFGADDEALVDQQLQRRVDGARAGPPQAAAAVGDLLDHLVAVHRTVGQQNQDGRADIATLASPASAATAARAAETEAAAGVEAEAAAAGAECRSRPGSRVRSGRARRGRARGGDHGTRDGLAAAARERRGAASGRTRTRIRRVVG